MANKYRLIVNEDNQPIVDGNNILLQQIEDDTCVSTLTEEIKSYFNITTAAAVSTCTADEGNCNGRVWCRNGILMPIAQVKQFQAQFLSTTMKNDKVWRNIAEEMAKHKFHLSPSQCRDKWKYLKQRDNMKDTHSGEERIKFEYYYELDDLLGKKPNVEPLAIASSSRENTSLESFTDDDDEPPQKKKRSDKNDSLMRELLNNVKQKDEARERRHQEMREWKEKTLEVFKDAMASLLKKL